MSSFGGMAIIPPFVSVLTLDILKAGTSQRTASQDNLGSLSSKDSAGLIATDGRS